ncbi:cysteine-rich receptor-like protein kinase 8 [Tanacetum coccineum]
MIALNAKNKMKIVTGQFPEPAMESELRSIWERNNDMLISWILNIVYYQKLKGFWDEFDALEAPYVCVCVCNCENGRVNGERDQRKRLIQFLMGLDESYSNIRGKILLMQPLPSTTKAYTMVKQEEKQREELSTKSTNHNRRSGFNPNTSTERRSNFRKGVYYGNCGKEGHFQEECYKIMGYLVGHPLHGKYQPPKTVNKSTRAVNLVVGQEDSKAQSSQTAVQPSDKHVSARMDQLQNQINQVLLMMQNNQGSTSQGIFSHTSLKIPKFIASLITNLINAWIIDSGAADHISITLTIMHNIHTLTTPILVKLSNGQTVLVTTIGSIIINANITLHNVFYILSFTYNIISVSKLLHCTSISLILTTSYCIFQDQNKRIAHDTLCDGLYFISPPPSSLSYQSTILQTSSTPSTWHSRLGHSSLTVLKKIKSLAHLFKCNPTSVFDVQGLYFLKGSPLQLSAYCDSDWAACPISRRLVIGYVVFLGPCLISWTSKKQSVASRSSTEAKYRALADCTCEITWLQCLFKDLQVQLPNHVSIYCDNASAIALASTPIHHARTKHIEIDYHFVRDKIRAHQINLQFTPSSQQTPDILTKGLPKALHYNCLTKFGICDP